MTLGHCAWQIRPSKMSAPLLRVLRDTAKSFTKISPPTPCPIANYGLSLISTRCLCTGASAGIDIGLPINQQSRTRIHRERKAWRIEKRKDPKFEQSARHRTLKIPLEEVIAEWETTSAPYQIRSVGHHYNIFQDLFDGADFLPQIIMHIGFDQGGEIAPVYRGNLMTPTEAASEPSVLFSSPPKDLWTLILVNPDGHLLDNNAEYLHWMVGNIPGNDISKGEVVCDYIKPFPAQGTGYHRFIFILFKQDGCIDFSQDKRNSPCHSLKERTFRTLDFYRRYEDVITPGGLNFFQCRWDKSVTDMYRQTLNMREPVYDYDAPPLYTAPQRKWPHKKRIEYLDKYIPPK
ncbi:large ribosomal subunit protein mL38-like [Saccoglossus kowalevskii]|uniref:Large ribosomal subunit protein mL38 n=1 Tax=Saccoglossus kowalevskii TaxID=10224 RepID=A0ABM0GNH8_SACKO|nr:PREDICTED: 39S ribosomal protein L38, mitochondrial-like [Saccoglossus kowalevskii]